MDKKVIKVKKFLFFLLALILLGFIFVPGYLKSAALRKENRGMLNKIRQIEQANRKLNEEIKLLDGDKEYIEKIAREKLGLTKEGEIIYKIVEEE